MSAIEILEKGTMLVMKSIDAGREHLSASHKHRYPTWDEMKRFREKYLDKDKFYVMVFPPKKHYVNCHAYCFHLWEVLDDYEKNLWGEHATG